MQAAARNGKYDIVRQAGMDPVKIHHDLENEKPPQPMVQKSVPQLNYQHLPPQPLTPSPLVQESPSPLNSQQFPLNPLSSRFQLAQKCAPTPQQVQNPALKCARPFLNGFKMRAACAPRCANFPKNPIFSPKTHKTAIFDNTSRQTPLENPAPMHQPQNPRLPLFHFFQETTTIHLPLNHPAPKPSPCSNPCGRLTWAQNGRGCGNETI